MRGEERWRSEAFDGDEVRWRNMVRVTEER